MTTIFSTSLMLAGLWAQASAVGTDTAPADDLSRQLNDILVAPTLPSQTRTSAAPAASGLMNPDISIIFSGVAGAATRTRASSAHDDPDFTSADGNGTGGFTVQEIEIGFRSVIDPYLAADVYLTIPNLSGIEIEEAYGTTTALPGGLQLKAGIFRSSISRQNEQHLHRQAFSLRPLINQAYLGHDGLRSPGVQASWLLPLPFFLRLSGEAMTVAPGDSATFGASMRRSPVLVGNARTFVPMGESWSLLLGASVATGHAPGGEAEGPGEHEHEHEGEGEPLSANGPRSVLAGGDLYLSYRPVNRVAGYFSVALQAEYFWRRIAAHDELDARSDAGFYAQLVAQLTRRWHAGVRFDQLGLPESELQQRGARWSAMTAFTPSEYSRVRLQGQREKVATGDAVYEALLLLELAMGAHGAHPF